MATNFSVTDTDVAQYVRDGGVNVSRYQRSASAVLQAVAASGGRQYPGLAPVETSIPVTHSQGRITSTSESQVSTNRSAQKSARAQTKMDLLIRAHDEVEDTTHESLMAQIHGVGGADGFAAKLIVDKTPAIYAGFDAEHLGAIATGIGVTDIEWNAAAPISTVSTALAAYDETDYNADAMILTRRGARQMGLATDGGGRLNSVINIAGLELPVFMTDCKSADIGVPNLLGILGPFASCAAGWAGATNVTTYDQLEPTNGGARERIISFLVARYLGFAKPPAAVIPNAGWTTITDDI